MTSKTYARTGYCIFVDTLCYGAHPVERDGEGYPVVYPTLLDAQREIAEDTIERLEQFLRGERDFDDAAHVEEYILAVDVLPDGSVCEETGLFFGCDC